MTFQIPEDLNQFSVNGLNDLLRQAETEFSSLMSTMSLDTATTEVMVNCSLVVVILAVTPWRYVWRNYVRATGDRWR